MDSILRDQLIENPDFLVRDCGEDIGSQGWQDSLTGGSVSWSECYQSDNYGLPQLSSDPVCADDMGYKYMYKIWKTEGQTNSPYKKLKVGHDDVQEWDDSSKNLNVIRQPCNRKQCHILPELESTYFESTDCSGRGQSRKGYSGIIMNIKKPGRDGYVINDAYTKENFWNGTLLENAIEIIDSDRDDAVEIGIGVPTDWIINPYISCNLLS